jgi:hypothetical protein
VTAAVVHQLVLFFFSAHIPFRLLFGFVLRVVMQFVPAIFPLRAVSDWLFALN